MDSNIMENVSSDLNAGMFNGSLENGISLPQFPFWRETLAVWTITTFLIQPPVIATDITLLVAMLKTKKLRNSLNFIHISILVSQIWSRLIFLLSYLTYFPPGWQNCNCSVFGSSLNRLSYIFVTVYEPVAFAFLSCLQLLQIKGKKKLKLAAIVSICISAAFSVIFQIEFIVLLDPNDLLLCTQVCLSDQQRQTLAVSSALIPVFLSFIPLAWIPSLITVIVTATWSCTIFKNSYTGGDNQLNRRILSIPLVMPIVIIANNLFSGFVMRALISEIFVRIPFGGFRRYWVAFAQLEITFFFDALGGFFYPILLLYLMPPLRQALRKYNATVLPAEQPTPPTAQHHNNTPMDEASS